MGAHSTTARPLSLRTNRLMQTRPIKVIHFVAGGFTGSTSVAIDLVKATEANPNIQSHLVLRERPATDHQRVEQLKASGLPVTLISGGIKLITIFKLAKICREFKADVLVAHGYTEHLWGRYAGLLAKVPQLIHVEHNSRENYSKWRLMQAHWLTKRTAAIVACAQGVRVQLEKLGFPANKIQVIENGVALERFEGAKDVAFADRKLGIVMPARFGKQKDHLTAIRAIALLRDRGVNVPLLFAGVGHSRYLDNARALTRELDLEQLITFGGHVSNLPEVLAQHRICLLSSHYEGMPIALAEGMAAGAAVIGTRAPGIEEMLNDTVDGLLVEHKSPESLTDAIAKLVQDHEFAERLGKHARERALRDFSLERMRREYEDLYKSLVLNGQDENNTQTHKLESA